MWSDCPLKSLGEKNWDVPGKSRNRKLENPFVRLPLEDYFRIARDPGADLRHAPSPPLFDSALQCEIEFAPMPTLRKMVNTGRQSGNDWPLWLSN